MSAVPAQRPAFADAPAAVPFDPAAVAHALRAEFPHLEDWLDATRTTAERRIAVTLPCYNEAETIADVVAGFAAALPGAAIVVGDNASTDGTATIAVAAGAAVVRENRRGKGNMVRRLFAEVDADIFVMADGDGTYDAAAVSQLIAKLVDERLDMVIGARQNIHEDAHRNGHAFGNRLFNGLYRRLFGADYGDIFSGYRVFSRRFVKSFPALSTGFEIETELSVHASQMRLPTGEISLPYGARPETSPSKLRTVHDGMRILAAFAYLLKETRPALFFGGLAGVVSLVAGGLAVPLVATWLETGLVPRLPTAMLCTGLIVVAALMATCGLILDSLTQARIEQKRILYLALTRQS